MTRRNSVARSASGLYARAGSALLAQPPDPLRDARAYVALFEATRLDPHDPVHLAGLIAKAELLHVHADLGAERLRIGRLRRESRDDERESGRREVNVSAHRPEFSR